MLCPACRTQMLTLEFAQIEIDYCRECGGAWLDSGEAALIGARAGTLQAGLSAALDAGSAAAGKPSERPAGKPSTPPAGKPDRKRRCPVCRKPMSRHSPPELAPAGADRCRLRHGLWFDRGELRRLIEISGPAQDNALVRFLAQLERQRQKEHPSTG
ncbi:MAG: zf-TFIIB domain-containing protein [Candidatus Brocadiia bacterium]